MTTTNSTAAALQAGVRLALEAQGNHLARWCIGLLVTAKLTLISQTVKIGTIASNRLPRRRLTMRSSRHGSSFGLVDTLT